MGSRPFGFLSGICRDDGIYINAFSSSYYVIDDVGFIATRGIMDLLRRDSFCDTKWFKNEL
jgi:hypothetical protein